MKSLSRSDVATLARQLPFWLEREQALLPALEKLGVCESQLRLLQGDQHLLRILAEESDEQSAEASRRELQRVLAWHDARLRRCAAEVMQTR